MAYTHPLALEAQRLAAANQFKAGLDLLKDALVNEPDHPELLTQYGLTLCWFQREDDALDALAGCHFDPASAPLKAALNHYLHCRGLMAAKLGATDEKGKAMASRFATFAPDAPKSPFGIALSAVLIVKNEAKHLRRCLESVRGNVDQIVVVDTGSTDETVAIAEEFGATLGHFDWINDFAAARNAALDLATGDWALWIDADEVMDEASWGPIREALTRPHFGGYSVRIVNYTDEEGNSTYTHAPVRLFQNLEAVRFTGAIHEQITPSLDGLGLPVAQLQNATIHHYGYTPTEMAAKNKVERTLEALLKQVETEPNEAFHWFNLANTYSVAGRHDDVISTAMRCLELLEPGSNYGSLTHQLLASAQNAKGEFEASLATSGLAQTRGCYTLLNEFEMAHALFGLNRYDEALESIDRCLGMDWPEDMTGDRGIKTHKGHVLKAQILAELGRLPKAMETVDQALAVDPNFGLAWIAKGSILDKLGKADEALAAFEKAGNDPAFAFSAKRAAAKCAMRWKRFEVAARWAGEAWHDRPAAKDAWSMWAMALEELGDPRATLAAYQEFTLYHEPNVDVFVNWGRSLEAIGDTEGALAKFRMAADKDAMDANARFNLGDACYRANRFLEAAEAYEAALQRNPENPEGWFCLGNALAQLGAVQGAATAYEQALRLNPNHTSAYHNLTLVQQWVA